MKTPGIVLLSAVLLLTVPSARAVQETAPSYQIVQRQVDRYLERDLVLEVEVDGDLSPEEARALVCELAPRNLLEGDGWADHVNARLDFYARETSEDDGSVDRARYRRNGVTRPGFVTDESRLVGDEAAFDHLTDCVRDEESDAASPGPTLRRVTDTETRTRYDVVDVIVGDLTLQSDFEKVVCGVLAGETPDESAVQSTYSVTLYRDMDDFERRPHEHLAWYDWQSGRPDSGRLLDNVSGETVSFSHVTGCG